MLYYRIGVDFGTAKPVISYLENGKLQVFEDIRKNECFRTQRLFQTSVHFSDEPEKPIPLGVPAEHLCEALLSAAVNCFNFCPHTGKLESLVLSIPETWYRTIDGAAKVRLEHSLVHELGIEDKLFQLVREPVAAAAYWIWMMMQQQKPKWDSNLLICDMGSSTFNVSLCHISRENKVKILYSDWQPQAGFVFDLQCIKLAYDQKHGLPLTEDTPEFFPLLRAFEQEKINSHQRSTNRLITYLKAPEAMANYNLYCFGGGYAVKCQQVIEAFAPIQQGIQEVIQRLNAWMQSNQQSFDFLFLIGGGCRFILTKNAILQALEIQDNDARFDHTFNDAHSNFAISYGACLIGNCLIDPVEKCPYALGFVTETLNVYAEREKKIIPLIQANTNLDCLLEAHFPSMSLLTAFQGSLPVITLCLNSPTQEPLFIDIKLDNIQLPNYSANNLWRLGIRVDTLHTLYLIIHNSQDQSIIEYEVGRLLDITVLTEK
ncbi:molecular chaperone [Anabaena cylindrica UHCC 0172]|uniref:Hsp70 family protein n=1 Tax=Anabaena cylindrica TaxID=1165 RepID=UPI002B2057B6|nr:molecular chaperone [Anabaena cylindrica]MEA5554037.1 molecular chaperone [Anabaena cylindrica UHCC 0172]